MKEPNSLSRTLGELAHILGGAVIGDEQIPIYGIAKIDEAGPEDLTFLTNPKYTKKLVASRAGALLAGPGVTWDRPVLQVQDPYVALGKLLGIFYPQPEVVEVGIHRTAVVEDSVTLGRNVRIGALCWVGRNCVLEDNVILYPRVVVYPGVTIGAGSLIHAGVIIRENVEIGKSVIIQNGAVIGSDGFGFAAAAGEYMKIPQVGTVIIEDDVEIGANTTIDRATMGKTIIHRGTKLDNLIQVAHNVEIGEDTVIAAQTGISGSTKIGKGCRIAGQVGFVGHITIGDRVMIGAQSGIPHSIPSGEIHSGYPAIPHAEWLRLNVYLKRLPELFHKVKELQKKIP
jgi:UDP-3-O-[3-hydroxymyristoyl] glucosamine N-acyltransferase